MSATTITTENSNLCAVVASFEQCPTGRWPANFPQKFVVPFEAVKVRRRVFRLSRPLDLYLEQVADGWSCEEPLLMLFGFGKENAEAVCSVFEDFSVLWDEIAQAPDDMLSAEAQRTKLELLALVKSVE